MPHRIFPLLLSSRLHKATLEEVLRWARTEELCATEQAAPAGKEKFFVGGKVFVCHYERNLRPDLCAGDGWDEKIIVSLLVAKGSFTAYFIDGECREAWEGKEAFDCSFTFFPGGQCRTVPDRHVRYIFETILALAEHTIATSTIIASTMEAVAH